MEENELKPSEQVVEQKPKKKGNGVVIFLLILIILGLAGYIYYDKFYKKELAKTEEKEKNVSDNTGVVVSKESIMKLAEDRNRHINTDFSFEPSNVYFDNQQNEYDIKWTISKGKLALKNNDKESLVSNISEDIVQIVESGINCDYATSKLVLTTQGNLYLVSIYDNGKDIDGLLEKISGSRNIKVYVEKINDKNTKVLAFTTSIGDDRGVTCGSADVIVYASDNTFRSSRDFNLVYDKLIIDSVDGFITVGFVKYADGTISVNGEDTVKNKNQADLKVSDNYVDEKGKLLYIIGEDDYLYVEKFSGEIILYKDSEIKSIKIDKKDNYYDEKLYVEFVNGETLNVTRSM